MNGTSALYVEDAGYDARYATGRLGLIVCNEDDVPLRVEWTQIKIWNIP